jgi:FHA domain
MKITSCVPIAGAGVIARYGDLVAVTDASGPDLDPLLSALTAVAAADGDGSALVLSAARAALSCAGQPTWGCAGVTADGGLAVLVHGRAVAVVRVDGGQDVQLTAADSVLPVSRTFTGMNVWVSLVAGDSAALDPRFRLDGGVVRGGGLAVTVSAGVAGPTVPPPDAMPSAVAAQAAHPGVESTANHAGTVVSPRARALLDAETRVEGETRVVNDETRLDQEQPPGVLVLDDGTELRLDTDYVIGREPVLDGDVIAGRAMPVRLSDPGGSVSRLHLRVSLVGRQVEVSDLGSANGSVLHTPGGERKLAPFEPTVIEPGACVGIGNRKMQYLSSGGGTG